MTYLLSRRNKDFKYLGFTGPGAMFNLGYSIIAAKCDEWPTGMPVFVITRIFFNTASHKLTRTCQPFSIGAELDR
jgi:hypothetical protein